MIINVLIPAIVMLLMVVVGTGLQVGQFRSVLRNKAALVGGSLAQVLLLPAGALIIVYFSVTRTGGWAHTGCSLSWWCAL